MRLGDSVQSQCPLFSVHNSVCPCKLLPQPPHTTYASIRVSVLVELGTPKVHDGADYGVRGFIELKSLSESRYSGKKEK